MIRNLYILEGLRRRRHCSEWVHPCFCPKQTDSHLLQPCDFRTLLGLPTPMAWLDYLPLGLPRSCYRSKFPKLQHYKSHWYTTQQQSFCIKQHIFSVTLHPLRQVEGGPARPKSFCRALDSHYYWRPANQNLKIASISIRHLPKKKGTGKHSVRVA